jgi:hypothetical protein
LLCMNCNWRQTHLECVISNVTTRVEMHTGLAFKRQGGRKWGGGGGRHVGGGAKRLAEVIWAGRHQRALDASCIHQRRRQPTFGDEVRGVGGAQGQGRQLRPQRQHRHLQPPPARHVRAVGQQLATRELRFRQGVCRARQETAALAHGCGTCMMCHCSSSPTLPTTPSNLQRCHTHTSARMW